MANEPMVEGTRCPVPKGRRVGDVNKDAVVPEVGVDHGEKLRYVAVAVGVASPT